MTILQAIVLGIVQGIGEFLPISSSGHLIIIPTLFGWTTHPVAFDIALHLGTLFAIVIYFRKKLITLIAEIFTKKIVNEDEKTEVHLVTPGEFLHRFFKSILFQLFLASLPAILFGLFLKDQIHALSDSIVLIAINLALWGIIFVFSKRIFKSSFKEQDGNESKLDRISFKNSIIIGLFQSLALFRGTSRSGSTIIGGLSQKLNLKDSVEFSFLLGIPIILGAVVLQLLDFQEIINSNISLSIYIIGILTSFISGLFTIKLFLKFIQKIGLEYFGIYRILLGIVLIVFFT